MSSSRALLLILIAFLTFSCEDREPRYRELPLPDKGAARLEIQAPASFTAGGTSKPELVVWAYDEEGNPLEGAHLSMFYFAGGDYFRKRQLLETGPGIYKALLHSTIAGDNYLKVIDGVSKKSVSAKVKVKPGTPATIRIHGLSPAAEPPRNATELNIELVDRYGNLSPVSKEKIQLEASFGNFTPLLEFAPGYFKTMISSGRQGKTVVTVSDTASGVSASYPVVFPALYAGFNQGRTQLGDTISIPISLSMDPRGKKLGHFDLSVNYNPGVIEYLGVLDPAPADAFNLASVSVVKPGTLRVKDNPNPQGGFNPFSWNDVAILQFVAKESGKTPIQIELWNNSETSLTDAEGNPLPYEPNVGVPEDEIKVTDPLLVQVNFYAVEGFGTEKRAQALFAKARELLQRSMSQGCEVDIALDSTGGFHLISKKDWEAIDLDHDNQLSIETATGEFLSKKGTIEKGIHYSKEIGALVDQHHHKGVVNVYLTPPLEGEEWTQGRAFRLEQDTVAGWVLSDAPQLLDFIVLSPQAKSEDALAHYLGRFFGLSIGTYERARSGACREVTLRSEGREESIRGSSRQNMMFWGERKLHSLVPPLYDCQCDQLMRSVGGYLEGLISSKLNQAEPENQP